MSYRAKGSLLTAARSVASRSLVSPLPSFTTKEVKSLPAAKLVSAQENVARVSAENMAAGTQSTSGGLLAHVGVATQSTFSGLSRWIETPGFEIEDSFRAIFDASYSGAPLNQGIHALMQSDLVDEITQRMVNLGAKLMGEYVSAIPVIGWVVGSAIDIGSAVREGMIAQRESNFPDLYKPLILNPALDEAVYSQWLGPLIDSGISSTGRPADWTDAFMPPGTTQTLGELSPFGFAMESDFTVSIIPRDPLGLGIIPGSGRLHQGIDLDTQGQVRDLGDFLPTAGQQGALLWQRVMVEGPAMFTVDTNRLMYWKGYLEKLRQYLGYGRRFQDGTYEPMRFWDKITNRVEFATRDVCYAALGKDECVNNSDQKKGARRWGRFASPADAKAIIDKYADPALFGWADSNGKYWTRNKNGKLVASRTQNVISDPAGMLFSTPVKAVRLLRKRQFKALDSLGVAYLEEGTLGAFVNDATLREHMDARRTQLLKHPSRCHLELDKVPGPDSLDGGIWKEQLVRSGVGDPQVCGPGAQIKGKKGLGINVSFGPGHGPAPLPTGMESKITKFALPGAQPKRSKIPVVVPLAAAGAAAYFFFPKVFK